MSWFCSLANGPYVLGRFGRFDSICLRLFVFKSCIFSPSLEVRSDNAFLVGDAVVTCMDGFDRITKVAKTSELDRV